jgi:orotidine-5'-phosphate decarboxylase
MNEKMDLAKRIIVALDVGSREEALPLIRQLEGVEIFKVGLKLFTSQDPEKKNFPGLEAP